MSNTKSVTFTVEETINVRSRYSAEVPAGVEDVEAHLRDHGEEGLENIVYQRQLTNASLSKRDFDFQTAEVESVGATEFDVKVYYETEKGELKLLGESTVPAQAQAEARTEALDQHWPRHLDARAVVEVELA